LKEIVNKSIDTITPATSDIVTLSILNTAASSVNPFIKVKVGPEERDLSEIGSDWIEQQVRRQRRDGPVGGRVTIKNERVNMVLATGACLGDGVLGRPPIPEEQKVLELWRKHGLDSVDFPPGHLVAFLKVMEGRIYRRHVMDKKPLIKWHAEQLYKLLLEDPNNPMTARVAVELEAVFLNSSPYNTVRAEPPQGGAAANPARGE
jgi:hypothetical protein